MELKVSAILMFVIILLMPLSGCIGDDEKEDEKVDDSEQVQEEILFEGDDVGECNDGADNDRDGLFDCDDPNCAGAPVCKLDENQTNETGNNTDEELRNYTVPMAWEITDLNNTELTNGAIDNAKCGLIIAWPEWDAYALTYVETLRNSISENREGEIIYVWSAIYEDSTGIVAIANIHSYLFEDGKAENYVSPYKILVENGSMIRLVEHSNNNQTGCEGEANLGLNSILQFDEPNPVCGDALLDLDSGESCDDGNTEDGDGCSSTCQIEPQPTCGDALVDENEQCDDGNTQDGDGCSSTCELEPEPTCGDAVVDENEQCDDGNTQDGDGCSSTCENEENPCENVSCPQGYTCDGEGNCQPPPDGTACDDGDPATAGDAYSDGVCVGTIISCPQNQVVDENGQCVCQQGLTDCNGECVDCGTDTNNCGACGVVCGEGYICNNGQCEYIGITHYIEIADMDYETLYLEIKLHDTVVWTNNDSVLHSVTSNDSHFDSGKISVSGDSWGWQFNNSGSFMYYCSYHNDMYAEIVVVQ